MILYKSNPQLKGLQSYGPSKLVVKKILDLLGSRLHFSQVDKVNHCSSSDPGSILGGRRLWAPTVSQPLNQIEVLLLFLKAMIYTYYEKDIQGGSIIFKVFYEYSKTPHFISKNDDCPGMRH